MPVRIGRLCLSCFVFLVFICTSWGQESTPARKLPSFFVVVRGATDLKQNIFQGKDQITYRLQAEYPAADALGMIGSRLKQMGWKPLKEDWLNPGLPSSHVRGWVYFEDSTTKPPTSVRAWSADWENSAHDIVTYMLDYTCPDNLCASTRDLHDLRVLAIHVPAGLAKQLKASILRDKAAR
jgi:hypothetical protein